MNIRTTTSFRRIASVFMITGIIAAQFVALIPQQALAAQITNRSLTLQAGATDGGSEPEGVVNHLFDFTLPGGSNVGSIQFEYCTTASGAVCTTPTDLDTTSATLGTESGVTGFTIDNDVNGAPFLTRTSALIGSNVDVTYRLDSVVNPSGLNETFFVRITTFSSIDATTGEADLGTVTASTADPIIISGTMPESLVFCTGETIGLTTGVPDCSTATAGVIEFDQLFSPTDTASTSSQLAASTNAGFGYVVTVNGPTLTSGGNTIAGVNAAAASIKGIGQFGLNLKANTIASTTAPIGIEVAPAADGVNLKGQAAAGYSTIDTFKFTTGDTVANSFNGGAGGTDAQIYTVSYIANVPGNQPAGTYTTTLTYICTPTF